MRRILTFSFLFCLFSTIIAAFDAYTPSLPLDIQSTEAGQDVQPVILGSGLQIGPQPCSGGRSNDYAFQESQTSDNQPVKRSYPFDNQEESPEVPINLDAESQKNNNLDPLPWNEAPVNIFSSSFNGQDTPNQLDASIFNINTDGTGNSAFEIAAKKKEDTTPDAAPTFEQDPTTGFVFIGASFSRSAC